MIYYLTLVIGMTTQHLQVDGFTYVYTPSGGHFSYYIDNPNTPTVCSDVDAFTSSYNVVHVQAGSCAGDVVFRNGFETP